MGNKTFSVHLMKEAIPEKILLDVVVMGLDRLELISSTKKVQHKGIIYDVEDIAVGVDEGPSMIFIREE